jgi:hypothetical protein
MGSKTEEAGIEWVSTWWFVRRRSRAKRGAVVRNLAIRRVERHAGAAGAASSECEALVATQGDISWDW